MSSIGERIRQRRVELRLSQRELASEGVSYAYISRLEADARRRALERCANSHRSSTSPFIGSKQA
jgi:transcriptional regulator with XRE-family HTH domain